MDKDRGWLTLLSNLNFVWQVALKILNCIQNHTLHRLLPLSQDLDGVCEVSLIMMAKRDQI
jgi:hypothetical protein